MGMRQSDDDEAPEVLAGDVAKQQSLDQKKFEIQARKRTKSRSVIRKDKAQSKLEKKETGDQEKFPAVEKESLHIPELPGDVIEALATRDLQENETNPKDTTEIKAITKNAKKSTHIKQFGNVQVQVLEDADKRETTQLSDSAKLFIEKRMAPTRKRVNLMRGHSAYFTKRFRATGDIKS